MNNLIWKSSISACALIATLGYSNVSFGAEPNINYDVAQVISQTLQSRAPSFTGGTANGNTYTGIDITTGNANNSNVTMTDVPTGNVIQNIIGAQTGSGDANDNIVDIQNSFLRVTNINPGRPYPATDGDVTAGKTSNGNANGNIINIQNSQVDGNVISGHSYGGNANNNKITFSQSTGVIIYSTSPTLPPNASKQAYAGYAESGGNANNNEILVTNGSNLSGTLIAGYAKQNSNNISYAQNNKITIENGSQLFMDSIGGKISCDMSSGGNTNTCGFVTNNTVTVSGNSQAGRVIGGQMFGFGSVSDNTVIIDNSTLISGAYGGYGQNDLLYEAGSASNLDIKNNKVIMSSGNISGSIYYGELYGGIGYGQANVEGNTVEMEDGYVRVAIYGGKLTGSGTILNNSVSMSGGQINGTVTGAAGSFTNLYGQPIVGDIIIQGNEVHISGAADIWRVIGATIEDNDKDTDIRLIGNKVFINGGNIYGSVYAAYANNMRYERQ